MIDESPPLEIREALGLLKAGRAGEAGQCLAAYCEAMPGDPSGWYLLGAALHAQGEAAAALVRMEHSLELRADQADVLKATALLLLELERYRAARRSIERVLAMAPEDPEAWLIAGSISEALDEGESALECYERALAKDGRLQAALQNRGALLLDLGRPHESLENNRRLAALFPFSANALAALAEAQLASGEYAEAAATCRRALHLDFRHAGARIDLALSLSMQGDFDDARKAFADAYALDSEAAESHFRRAIQAGGLDPGLTGHPDPEDLFLWQHGEQQKSCNWRDRARLARALAARAARLASDREHLLKVPPIYFQSLSLPLSSGQQLALAQGLARAVERRTDDGRPVRPPTRYRNLRGPLRIGYLSPDFRHHPVAHLHWRQLTLHDRRSFRVYAYSLHPEDGSEVGRQIRSSADVLRECHEDPPRLTAARIRYDGIHILVDLSGYTRFTRPEILALRPAPIQAAYMGMPATSGGTFIDYRITDPTATPKGHAPYWTESLVHFPDTLFIYNNEQEIAQTPRRKDVGLPEEAFVFCCFNNAYKIEPDAFSIWMRLLRSLPGSVIWLLSDEQIVRNNLRREAEARGVAGERLVFAEFLPFSRHLARYALADLFLDTFYCGAHTTAADALWGGLPVLTCLGHTMAARQAGSIVRAAGLPELVVGTHEEYEALAFRLATRPVELAGYRRRLKQSRSGLALFDTHARVRELEFAFAKMWERHSAGLPPETFTVPSHRETSA